MVLKFVAVQVINSAINNIKLQVEMILMLLYMRLCFQLEVLMALKCVLM